MWVARQMGHSTMKMLLENYSRWIDLADKQREKSKIEQLLSGKCANSVPKNTEMEISTGYLSDILVEAGGIEPPSDGGATGLLRVQSASDFLSPGVSREQGRRRAQSMKSPESPTDTGSQQWLPR